MEEMREITRGGAARDANAILSLTYHFRSSSAAPTEVHTASNTSDQGVCKNKILDRGSEKLGNGRTASPPPPPAIAGRSHGPIYGSLCVPECLSARRTCLCLHKVLHRRRIPAFGVISKIMSGFWHLNTSI